METPTAMIDRLYRQYFSETSFQSFGCTNCKLSSQLVGTHLVRTTTPITAKDSSDHVDNNIPVSKEVFAHLREVRISPSVPGATEASGPAAPPW